MARSPFRFLLPLAVLSLAVGAPALAASAATSGTWTVTGSMNTARFQDDSAVLPDGEVLVLGGSTSPTSAELYNPATGTWSSTGSMASPREGQQATLLPDGNVLVSAGIEAAAGSFAELYNPTAGTWSAATGGLNACVANFDCRIGSSATLLGNGQVLVAGGLYGLDTNPSSTASAILYNPATNSWTLTGSLTTAREDQTSDLLTSGQVLAAGGANFVSHKFTALSSAELYTP